MAIIIEDICIIKAEVCKNPIYLTWKNTLGGWDSWLFQFKQAFGLTVSDTGDFERFFDDLSSQNTVSDWLKKNSIETISLGDDNLSTDEAIGLQEILESPKVYMFVELRESPAVPIFKTVKIDSASFQIYRSDLSVQVIEFTINLPKRYTLSN